MGNFSRFERSRVIVCLTHPKDLAIMMGLIESSRKMRNHFFMKKKFRGSFSLLKLRENVREYKCLSDCLGLKPISSSKNVR